MKAYKKTFNLLKRAVPARERLLERSQSPFLCNNLLFRYLSGRNMRWITANVHRLPPDILIIENTNRCNARCTICAHPRMTRPQGVMDVGLFEQVISEAVSLGIRRVQLNATGEPLLDPHVVTRIRYAKEKGVPSVHMFTNASLLQGSLAEEILESGLDLLIVSVDDFSEEGFEKLRPPLRFDTIKDNLTGFIALRRRRGLDKPQVRINACYPEDNSRHFESSPGCREFRRLVDRFHINRPQFIHDWAGSQPEALKSYRRRGDAVPRTPCRQLYGTMNVHWDGRVALCCLDYDGQVILGDLSEESLTAVWRGEAYGRLRAAHERLEFDALPLCGPCGERPQWLMPEI